MTSFPQGWCSYLSSLHYIYSAFSILRDKSGQPSGWVKEQIGVSHASPQRNMEKETRPETGTDKLPYSLQLSERTKSGTHTLRIIY